MNLFCGEAPIVAGFVWVLAAWTISVHFAVATGGSFTRLLQFSPMTLLIAAIGWFVSARQRSEPIPIEEDSNPKSILWLIAAAAVLLTYLLGYSTFWLVALIYLCTAWITLTLSGNTAIKGTPKIVRSRSGNLGCPLYLRGYSRRMDAFGLAALCLACVFITLLLHQPDIDDAFYISVAADAHRHPDRAIWSTDTVHDDPALPVFLPIYKAEAYEYLIALVAKVLHISSVRAAHTALPIGFSIFVALAWAMLARAIDPKNWLAITAVTIFISLFAGATKPGPANYAFTRLQQGKSVMVSAIVPILCVYAFRLATLGGWRNAVMLATAQIAGVGLSSTSMVIGPAVVCAVGFFSVPVQRRRSLRYAEEPGLTPSNQALRGTSETGVIGINPSLLRMVLILATCIYPILVALLMRNKMLAVDWLADTPAQPAADVLTHVLGDRAQLWFFLATLVGAWAVAPRRSQSLLLAPCILLLAVMINPLLTHLLQSGVLTPNTYWRGLWVLPWLVWSAVFICGLSTLVGTMAGRKNPVLSRAIAMGFAAVVLATLLGRHPIWRNQNGTTIHLGGLAANEPEYSVAERLATETPPGSAALAPEIVACWTAVLDERPRLIFVRSFYTQANPNSGGLDDVRSRNQLGEIAGKHRLSAADIAALLAGADRYRLGSIVLLKSAGDQVALALKRTGFSEETIGGYSIWIRRRF